MTDAEYVERIYSHLSDTIDALIDYDGAARAPNYDSSTTMRLLGEYRAKAKQLRELITRRLIELARKCGDAEPDSWGVIFHNEVADAPSNVREVDRQLRDRSPRLHAMMTMLRAESGVNGGSGDGDGPTVKQPERKNHGRRTIAQINAAEAADRATAVKRWRDGDFPGGYAECARSLGYRADGRTHFTDEFVRLAVDAARPPRRPVGKTPRRNSSQAR